MNLLAVDGGGFRFRPRYDVRCHVDEYGSEKHSIVRVLLSGILYETNRHEEYCACCTMPKADGIVEIGDMLAIAWL